MRIRFEEDEAPTTPDSQPWFRRSWTEDEAPTTPWQSKGRRPHPVLVFDDEPPTTQWRPAPKWKRREPEVPRRFAKTIPLVTFPRASMPKVIIIDAPPPPLPLPRAIEIRTPPPVTKTRPRTQPRAQPKTRRPVARRILALLVLAPVVGIVGSAPRSHRSTRAPAPAPALSPAPSSRREPPSAPSPHAAPLAAPAVAPSATIRDDVGLVRTDHSHPGHRIFVNGRVVGTTPETVLVKCGPATIKLGIAGRPHAVVIPCGGETRIP